MPEKRFGRGTKVAASLVLLPIPYCLLAGVICAMWHTQLRLGAVSGRWFDFCMPDGILFNLLLSVLAFMAVLALIPVVVLLIKDLRLGGND
jgi:hypothetical protein